MSLHPPRLDLTQPLSAQQEAWARIAAAGGTGRVAGHGIAAPLLHAAAAGFERLVAARGALPADSLAHVHPLSRGFELPFEASGAQEDSKFGWVFGPELGPDHPAVAAGTPWHGPNPWPGEALAPGFRSLAMASYAALQGLALRLLPVMAAALEVPAAELLQRARLPMGALRLLHYPPRRAVDDTGIAAHRDWSCLSLIWQREPGLWVEAGDTRQAVAAEAGEIVLLFGETAARLAGDAWTAPLHGVGGASAGARTSIAFFLDLDADARVLGLGRHARPGEAGQSVLEAMAAGHARDYATQG